MRYVLPHIVPENILLSETCLLQYCYPASGQACVLIDFSQQLSLLNMMGVR